MVLKFRGLVPNQTGEMLAQKMREVKLSDPGCGDESGNLIRACP